MARTGTKNTPTHVSVLARKYTAQAIKTLVEVMGNTNAPPRDRITAAALLINRGWGVTQQEVRPEAAETKSVLQVRWQTAAEAEWNA